MRVTGHALKSFASHCCAKVVREVKLPRCGKIRSRASQSRITNDAQHAPACFFVPVSVYTRIMVAQMGQPKGWPVSFGTGIANPVWATTI